MENNIRKISVGIDPKETMNWVVGNKHRGFSEGKSVERVISQIVEAKKHFLIYMEADGVTQLWKKLPKNQYTSIEYDLE